MSSGHISHVECEHTYLNFCKTCKKPFCTQCNKEWQEQSSFTYFSPLTTGTSWTYNSSITTHGAH